MFAKHKRESSINFTPKYLDYRNREKLSVADATLSFAINLFIDSEQSKTHVSALAIEFFSLAGLESFHIHFGCNPIRSLYNENSRGKQGKFFLPIPLLSNI